MVVVNHTLRLSTAALLAMVLGSYVIANAAEASSIRNLSHVNKSIHVDRDERVGNVSTVNGRIVIDSGAVAGRVDTVNGRIELENDTTVVSADTVNGRIEVGTNVQVQDKLETVNGGIRVRANSEVGGQIHTVNGSIELFGARAGDELRTANGNIELRDGAVVEGDVIFRASHSWLKNLFSFGRDRHPVLVIDADSVVEGTIHLYREVDLRIHEDARIGEIIEY